MIAARPDSLPDTSSMRILAFTLLALPLLTFGYAYVGYPLVLRMLAWRRRPGPAPAPAPEPEEWPFISITVPAYNEARAIRDTLDTLLQVDYPADRRQILVISDASTDGTDDIVREYADRGVELLRMPERAGKTAAENAAGRVVRGEIIVNTDASVRLTPNSLKPLVRAFADPEVGVASGRDVSVGDLAAEGTGDESKYVGYEMQIRSLETRLGGIVGASGCFYGFRRDCHDTEFPEQLSRDFASCLIARERGYRAVSVDDALCVVPRTTSLQAEFRRKVRTMARGLATLWHKRHLMSPVEHGLFAWMLVSHKLFRWIFYLTLPLALVGLVLLAISWPSAALVIAALALAAGVCIALGIIGMRWPQGRAVPRLFALPGFALASTVAGLVAWHKWLSGERNALWEPTRRPG